MYRWFLALRWLSSRPINLLGMVGIMLGVWALVVVVSIFSGYIAEVRRHVHAASSDLTVWRLSWPTSWARVRDVVLADPNVAAAAPRLVWYGLLHPTAPGSVAPAASDAETAHGIDTPFVVVLGIDPELEAKTTGFTAWVAAVTDAQRRADAAPEDLLLPRGNRPAIVASERRLRHEGLGTGDEVRLTTARMDHGGARLQQEHLNFIDETFVVAGAYATPHAGFDAVNTFAHIDTLRRLLASPTDGDVVNEVVVRVRDASRLDETALRLERQLAGDVFDGVLVHTWEQRNAQFLSAVDHQRGLMKLVLFVIMVVAAFLMYATLSMMVTEKVHDIGILTAMGAPPRGVLQVFLACGLAITAAGTALGLLTGWLSSLYLDTFNNWLRATFGVDLFPVDVYNLKHVPHDTDPLWLLQVAAASLLLGVLVAGVPAWRAARHDPLESLRNE